MRILSVVGARPQFIKAAIGSRAMKDAGIDEVLVHTGQHYDAEMSAVFFQELGLAAPRHDLGIGSGPHGAQTGRMLEALERVMGEERPDRVVVYGDTNSTLAGALAAAKLHIPVAHVEAGLRSGDRRMPEEINRIVADQLATMLLCPSAESAANLAREGITAGVHVVGDVMYDCVRAFETAIHGRRNELMQRLDLEHGGYYMATVHRAGNTDDAERLHGILGGLHALARHRPVVFPVHPRLRSLLRQEDGARLRLLPPLPYLDTQALVAGASCILTDSGGLQKEAYYHRVPCVTLRPSTEWTETVVHGCNVLADADPTRIEAAARQARFPDGAPAELYGSGDAGLRIAALLRQAP